jgi:RHS repeat-associated protein
VLDRAHAFGDSINLTGIADNLTPARSESYAYTAANRLQQGDGIWGTLTWNYDLTGNRTSEVLTSGSTTTSTYNYPGGNNLLSTITQDATTVRSFAYDGAGNISADTRGSTAYAYSYNNRGRLSQLTIGSTVTADYTYDALERLAIRTTQNMTPSGTTHYLYDLAGHLIAEASEVGAPLREYIWLDDLPLAVVADLDTQNPNLYFVHADHLDRPVKMTDGNKTVVWDAVYKPFGDVNSITGSATNNLRFPGQYFLIESGLHYNWHRHYDPTLGRYLQPDPLGFVDGPSVYAYAGSAPTQYVDPEGRFVPLIVGAVLGRAAIGALIGGGLDFALQLAINGGRLDCVDKLELFESTLLGALGAPRAIGINARNALAVSKGLDFEAGLLKALGVEKNYARIGSSIPDALSADKIIEAKSSNYITSSRQFREILASRRAVDLYVNQNATVSSKLRAAIETSGGTIRRFNLSTGLITPY